MNKNRTRHRGLSTALAILAAAAGLSAFASSAHAVVIDNVDASLTSDPNVTLTDANVAFDFTAGVATPKLTGTLEAVDLDGRCVRVRLSSYNGDTLLHSKPGTMRRPRTTCITSGTSTSPKTATRSPTGLSSRSREGRAGLVEARGSGAQDVRPVGSVTLNANGFDLGGAFFSGGTPTLPAVVSWSIDDGQVTPLYDGVLHFDGFANCGRVQLRYLDEAGAELDVLNGPKHCAPDNDYYSFGDRLDSFTSPLVSQIEVVMQSDSGGEWSDTVSIEESPQPLALDGRQPLGGGRRAQRRRARRYRATVAARLESYGMLIRCRCPCRQASPRLGRGVSSRSASSSR